MTKEEILAMKPGRDLDIKVALEVMGYMWFTHLIHFSEEMTVKWLGTQADLDASKGAFVAVKPEKVYELKQRDRFDEAVPNYSTDLDAARQVAGKILGSGCQISEGLSAEQVCKIALEKVGC
ncbi:hypothetical protein SDC9_09098 [bioreactor metagenome]|uniref:Uncharacterized protein n=1 Tax=bioreactor metagenome TaxID=1076179 RepID=A0A644T9G0_9ZZZZ|nr:hypothetical protein [Negativicutes bacterium]